MRAPWPCDEVAHTRISRRESGCVWLQSVESEMSRSPVWGVTGIFHVSWVITQWLQYEGSTSVFIRDFLESCKYLMLDIFSIFYMWPLYMIYLLLYRNHYIKLTIADSFQNVLNLRIRFKCLARISCASVRIHLW